MTDTLTAFVTGASSGIGLAVATQLSERGYRVIGTARNPDLLDSSKKAPGVEYVTLDLADPDSIEKCGPALSNVDILVNNAGEATAGPFEELPRVPLERTFQINVLGPVRLTQLALPGMRERQYGRVVMVGSMLASFPIAYRSSYVAVKAALKGFTTAARGEVARFGVYLTTVEPAAVKTGIGHRRVSYSNENSPYQRDLDRLLSAAMRNDDTGVPPETAAATILRAIHEPKPKPLYAVGRNAQRNFAIKRLISDEHLERRMAKAFGITL
jgi:short-subunit dehydrogenase